MHARELATWQLPVSAPCVEAERAVMSCCCAGDARRGMRVLRYDVNKDDKVSFEEIVAADHELRKEVQLE